jgi:hypothetical protein
MFNLARKRHQSKKFLSPWVGPFKVTNKRDKLNYQVNSLQGKEMWVHVNRLKRPIIQKSGDRSRNGHVLDRDSVDTGSKKEQKKHQEKNMKN